MCLYSAETKRLKKNLEKRTYGYKIFRRRHDYNIQTETKLSFQYQYCYEELRYNRWYEDTSSFLLDYNLYGETYPTGYHVYTNKKDALKRLSWLGFHNLEVHKVQIKDIVAIGEQHNVDVIVCKQMLIEKEIIKWKM